MDCGGELAMFKAKRPDQNKVSGACTTGARLAQAASVSKLTTLSHSLSQRPANVMA
jgi:transposase